MAYYWAGYQPRTYHDGWYGNVSHIWRPVSSHRNPYEYPPEYQERHRPRPDRKHHREHHRDRHRNDHYDRPEHGQGKVVAPDIPRDSTIFTWTNGGFTADEFNETEFNRDANEVIGDTVVKEDQPRAIANGGLVVNKKHEKGGEEPGPHVTKPPFAYATFIANHPKVAFGITGAFHLTFVLLTAILLLAGYDILPINFEDAPLDVEDHWTYLRTAAWLNRDDGDAILYKSRGLAIDERTEVGDALQLLYTSNNVFTREHLQSIAAFEDSLVQLAGYQDFCRLDEVSHTCVKPLSIVRFFDGTYGPQFNDSTYSDIPGTLSRALEIPFTKSILQSHLSKSSVINGSTDTATSWLTRSIIYFGVPRAGFVGVNDMRKQVDEIKVYLADNFVTKLKESYDNGVGGMSFHFFSLGIYYHTVFTHVTFDLALAVASGTFIFLFMWFQTQSLFVTVFAIGSILTSFLCTNLFYRIVLDYRFLGTFHVLSIFIILGIGADNIFLYYDNWRATGCSTHPSLAHRISECYRRAAVSMFITSLTTMVAFLSNAFTPLLLISSFGVFSAILIMVNYLSVVTFFPVVVVLYHKHWENWAWPCFRRCCPPHKPTPHAHRRNHIVHFFSGPYFRFIKLRVVQVAVILIFAGAVSFLAYSASSIEPQDEEIKLFRDSHHLLRARDLTLQLKPSTEDNNVVVYVVWGMKNQDRSNCHKTDFVNCRGETVWDDSFDLNPKPAQVALLELCHRIRELNGSLVDDLRLRRSLITGKIEIECFIDDMNNYMQSGVSGNLEFPLTEQQVSNMMTSEPDLYNMSTVSPLFYRNFEVAMSSWLYSGYSGVKTRSYRTFSKYLGETTDPRDTAPVLANKDYYYGTRLRYAAIAINTTIKVGELGYTTGMPIIDAWEDFVRDEMESMPPSLSGGFQCTPEINVWHWMELQKVLVDGAIRGIVIGLCLSFPILTLATQNIVLGALATFIICCVTVSVIGVIPLAGWKLGFLESLNMSLVVGLAVDYVVHLAEGYHKAPHHHRLDRLQYTLENVGVSVLSGATSTLGASMFLLFAVIMFFMQFGLFMFSIIGFSLFYSLVLFTCLLGLIGPSGNTGSLNPFFRWCWRKIKHRKASDVDCDRCEGRGFHAARD